MRSAVPAAAVLLLASCGGAPPSPSGLPSPTPPPGVPGCLTTTVPLEGALHVAEGSPVSYVANPPASGPHYPVWARYEEYAAPLARGYWVHNLEHGGIVFLFRPDTPAGTVNALRDVYRGLPDDPACGHKRALFTPDPLMAQQTAVVAWGAVLQSNCNDAQAVRAFVAAYRGRGPENVCSQGTRP